MNIRIVRLQGRLMFLMCCLALLSACATTMGKNDSVEERAIARWETLLAGDLDGAYQYLSPGYRSSVSSLAYQRSLLLMKVRWTSAKYLESECEETTCNVKIQMGYTIYGGVPGVKSFDSKQTVEESWVLVDGEWYLVPKK